MRSLVALVIVGFLVAPFASALPTPGVNGETFEAATGRIFPEALQTNDFVSYDEAIAGLTVIDARAPDRVELVPLGASAGWMNKVTGERASTDLFAVEITNEQSPIPEAEKLTLVFFLSIHGNEKGGREGGLRVIEDLALERGLAVEEPDLLPMLDFQKLVFIFANTDGWTHEEVVNHANNVETAAALGVGYTRENANGTDLNRQFPTVGYLYEGYTPLSEPESQGMVPYTKSLTNVVAGADLHGMLQNTNLVRLLLKDGEKSQQQLFENERIAELYKERLNDNPHYAAWATAPEQTGVCCGQVAEWAATFDAIGYSASGTAGAWIVQQQGLGAPGYTVEYAYNHAAFDNQYEGPGAVLNDYHVEATRDIVSVFMNFASEKVNLSVETHDRRTAVLASPYVVTNADDDKAAYGGWFAETAVDDAFDILNNDFQASPHTYWTDLQSFVRSGDGAGVLDVFEDVGSLTSGIDLYDNLVVPGSAIARGFSETDASALRAWVEAGGNLVLTDAALQLLAPLGVVDEASVGNKSAYSGYTDIIDREHEITHNLKGFPRQTYDPNPLGFAPGTSPVWFVDRVAWEGAGGVSVGGVAKTGTGEAVVEDPADCTEDQPLVPLWMQRPDHDHFGEGVELALPRAPVIVAKQGVAVFENGVDCQELDATNLGVLKLGAGTIHIYGAILPDPTEEANHPYGLDDYAVAANGNLALLNMLGFEYVYTTPPAIEEYGFARALAGEPAVEPAAVESPPEASVPGAPIALVLVVVLIAAAMLGARTRP